MLQLCPTENDVLLHSLSPHVEQTQLHSIIEDLLASFLDIFQELAGLPPRREGHDHKIPLLQGANPVNKRPYRYAKQQKDIIDGLIQEFLKSAVHTQAQWC